MPAIHAMTERQLRLFYREAQRHERQARAGLVADVNAGTAGGKHAKAQIKALTDET